MRRPCAARLRSRITVGRKHAGDVGGGGSAATGSNFFGDAAAADDFAALEDERGKAGAGEIGRGGQAVVPCADYDCVVGLAERRHVRLS